MRRRQDPDDQDDPYSTLPEQESSDSADPYADLPEQKKQKSLHERLSDLSSPTQRRYGREEKGVDLEEPAVTPEPRSFGKRVARAAGQFVAGAAESTPYMVPGAIVTEGAHKIVAAGSTPLFQEGSPGHRGHVMPQSPAASSKELPRTTPAPFSSPIFSSRGGSGNDAKPWMQRVEEATQAHPWPVAGVSRVVGEGANKIVGAPEGVVEEGSRMAGGFVGPVAGHKLLTRIRASAAAPPLSHESVLDRPDLMPPEPPPEVGAPRSDWRPYGETQEAFAERKRIERIQDNILPPALGTRNNGRPAAGSISVSGRPEYVPKLEPPALGAPNEPGRAPYQRPPYVSRLERPALGAPNAPPPEPPAEPPAGGPPEAPRGADRRVATEEAWNRAGAPRAGDLTGPAAVEAAQQRVGGKRFAEEVELEKRAMEMSGTPGGEAAAVEAVARDILSRDRRLKQSKLELSQGGDRRDADRPDSREEADPYAGLPDVAPPAPPLQLGAARSFRERLENPEPAEEPPAAAPADEATREITDEERAQGYDENRRPPTAAHIAEAHKLIQHLSRGADQELHPDNITVERGVWDAADDILRARGQGGEDVDHIRNLLDEVYWEYPKSEAPKREIDPESDYSEDDPDELWKNGEAQAKAHWDRARRAEEAIDRDQHPDTGKPLTKEQRQEFLDEQGSAEDLYEGTLQEMENAFGHEAVNKLHDEIAGEIAQQEEPAREPRRMSTGIPDAKTGQRFRAKLMRGQGREGSPYSEGSAGVPILGEGRYTTDDRAHAADVGGPEISEHDVELDNPLVIESDAQWQELTRHAGWIHPNPTWGEPGRQKADIARMRKMLEDRGHDGVVVRIPTFMEGTTKMIDERTGKTLEKVFGGDQVLEFYPPEEPAPKKGKAPKPAEPERRPTKELGGVVGRTDRVKLSDQTSHQVEYRWARLGDVHGSINPETFQPTAPERFRQGIQQRTYSKADQENITDRSEKNRLDPDRMLDPTRSIEQGPPTVTKHGEAVSGTERVTRIKRAAVHDPEAYAEYLRRAREDAVDFGLDPEQLHDDGILVRVLTDPKLDQEDVGKLSRMNERSDKTQTKLKGRFQEGVGRAIRFRDAEIARRHLTETIGPDQSVRDYLGTGVGREFVQLLVTDGVIDRSERAAYMKGEGGHATEEGKVLVENMLRGAAFGDAATLDAAAPSLLNKFDPVLGPIAKTGGMKGYELQGRLQRAMKLISDAGDVTDLEAYYGQSDFSREPPAPVDLELATFLQDAPRSQLVGAIRRYVTMAEEAVKQGESESMFGDKPQTSQELIDRAIRESKPNGSAKGKTLGMGLGGLEGGFITKALLLRTGAAAVGAAAGIAAEDKDDKWWERALKVGLGAVGGYAVAGMAGEIFEKGVSVRDAIRRFADPAARSEQARTTADLIRRGRGNEARELKVAEHRFKSYRNQIGKLPIAQQHAFIDNIEKGKPQGNPLLDKPAQELRKILDHTRDMVRGLGTGALSRYYRDYFPHIWKDPQAALDFVNEYYRRRPLEGSKNFLKKRTHPTMADGLAAGLEPVSNNAVDLAMLKIREMHKYIFAHRLMAEMRQRGLRRFAPGLSKGPEGYAKLDDRISTLFGSPEVPIIEAFDAQVRGKLNTFLADLNINHQREVNIGGSRLGYASSMPEHMVTKFGGPDTVIEHELGHILDYRYGLWDKMLEPAPKQMHTAKRGKRAGQTFQRTTPQKADVVQARKAIDAELRNLADLRDPGGPAAQTKSRTAYLHNKAEKIANTIHALIYAPELMDQVAPNLKAKMTAFLKSKPELAALLEIKPSLQLAGDVRTVKVKGTVIAGQYWFPEPVAKVINNHLSPGLQGNALYDLYRGVGNTLNQAQLGLSAFHLGFTSMEAVISKNALAIRQIARGDVLGAAKSVVTAPAAPLMNILEGHRLKKAYQAPGSQGPLYEAYAQHLAEAGGRVEMDSFYRTGAAGRFVKALEDRRLIPAAWHGFSAAIEFMAKPVMEWVVPRQKLGVFMGLMKEELARLPNNAGPDEVLAAQRRAWDSTDNRLGQMVYDNLFWDHMFQDAAMASVRSVGWNLGTVRELGGGMADLARGRLTAKASYAIALPLTTALVGGAFTYLATGQRPKDLKDYFYPRTGRTNSDGSEERIQLPTYMKDLMAYKKSWVQTLGHKLHPGVAMVADMLQNEDYYGDRIRNDDDPVPVQIGQYFNYALKQFKPFAIANAQEEVKRGGQGPVQVALPFIGVTPAPRSATRTDAQNRMMEIFSHSTMSGASPEESERRSGISLAIQQLRAGDAEGFRRTVGGSRLTGDDIERIIKRAQGDPWIERFKRLTVEQAQDVFSRATLAEKGVYAPILIDKLERAAKASGKNDEYEGLLQPVEP